MLYLFSFPCSFCRLALQSLTVEIGDYIYNNTFQENSPPRSLQASAINTLQKKNIKIRFIYNNTLTERITNHNVTCVLGLLYSRYSLSIGCGVGEPRLELSCFLILVSGNISTSQATPPTVAHASAGKALFNEET